MTVRSEIHLADGRELFYYDREPGSDRSAPDRRTDLPTTHTTSQIRWNPLMRDYATIAGHRQNRTYKPPAGLCPLCPSRNGAHTEVPAADYEVAVFENRFPSYSLHSAGTVPLVTEPPFMSGPGAGRCEVVCFTSNHDQHFHQLSTEQARTVVDAWADRTSALAAVESIEYVFCFENRGEEIGVTLTHPHGQIYGYPFVPPRFYKMIEALRSHRQRAGRCLQCDLLRAELDAGLRIVEESEHWVAYVPFAARWPYEVRLVPRRHLPGLPALDDAERNDLARIYLSVLGRYELLFDTPIPYVAGWQQAPVRAGTDDGELWHLAAEVFTIMRAPGILKFLAGSESGAGVWINDVAPEEAARRLRDVRGGGGSAAAGSDPASVESRRSAKG
jgi:UDPglucose--hexose-1-phosphate uridylyltransferase